MLNLTDWIYILKKPLRSAYTEKQLREKILSDCLMFPGKLFGSYCVDADKIWINIIQNDDQILFRLNELRIDNVMEILSYYENIKYKQMRGTYPRNRHKKGG